MAYGSMPVKPLQFVPMQLETPLNAGLAVDSPIGYEGIGILRSTDTYDGNQLKQVLDEMQDRYGINRLVVDLSSFQKKSKVAEVDSPAAFSRVRTSKVAWLASLSGLFGATEFENRYIGVKREELSLAGMRSGEDLSDYEAFIEIDLESAVESLDKQRQK